MSGDIIYFQTIDGKRLYVPDKEVRLLAYGNFGAPPVEFITRRGYRQHGVTEVDYVLTPRTITTQLWHDPMCTRQEYWDARLRLHEFLRHNRGGPMTFVLRQPNGNLRALVVRANPGMQFPMQDSNSSNWDINETLDLIAFDPVWFDPVVKSSLTTSVSSVNLVFPITFPIQFGSSSIVSDVPITYLGTWHTYPTLTVFGPFSAVIIENTVTHVQIHLTVDVLGGERRIINLTPGEQSVIDGNGINRFGELGPETNLVDWNLRPDPESPGGVQNVLATFFSGAVGTTALEISYNERFFAL